MLLMHLYPYLRTVTTLFTIMLDFVSKPHLKLHLAHLQLLCFTQHKHSLEVLCLDQTKLSMDKCKRSYFTSFFSKYSKITQLLQWENYN